MNVSVVIVQPKNIGINQRVNFVNTNAEVYKNIVAWWINDMNYKFVY